MKKVKKQHKGNKYQTFSQKVSKEGEIVADGTKGVGDCPKCDCCQSSVLNQKAALCINCHDGLNGHQKWGKRKPVDRVKSI